MINRSGIEIQKEFRSNQALCGNLIELFQLIANKCRFRIICTLTQGDFCVNDIAEIIDETKVSNVSQHLKMLRLAGIVSAHRDEKRMIYHLEDERVRGLVGYFKSQYLEDDSMEENA